jgi:tetratricopeptide (TPR) repeat protein
MGRLDEAAGLYDQILRGHRSDEIAFQMLGLINHRLGKAEKAKYYYHKLLDLNPVHFETLYNLGLLEREEGNQGLAEEYMRKLAAQAVIVGAERFERAAVEADHQRRHARRLHPERLGACGQPRMRPVAIAPNHPRPPPSQLLDYPLATDVAAVYERFGARGAQHAQGLGSAPPLPMRVGENAQDHAQ